jgi:uncharacterized protein (TIGR02145 family)
MAKNLAIDDGQGGILTQIVNYGEVSVTEYYYTWNAAVRVAASIEGWHLPTRAEWDILASTVGSGPGTKLKSTYGWSSGNGTDNYGFTALPAGRWYSNSFSEFGTRSSFWTSESNGSSSSYYRYFSSNSAMNSNARSNSNGLSIRLVKDS